MFDRFTDRSRKVMGLARQEAQRFNHQYIGSEHILLGLIQEGSGVAANVLRNLKVDPQRVQFLVEKGLQDGPTMVTMGQLPFTPRAKKALELSSAAADKLRHNYIGTEHLLLGLVALSESPAAQVLIGMGLTLDGVRTEVMELLGHGQLTIHDGRTSFDDYQDFTRTTAVYPGAGKGGFPSIVYCVLGLTGEAGEIAEKVKKRFRLGGIEAFEPGSVVLYTKTGEQETFEEFVETLEKEMGDVLWYLAGLSAEVGKKLSSVANTNVKKLSSRKARGVLKGSGDDR